MKCFYCFVGILFLLLFHGAGAQNTILRGTVRSAATGGPIPGVTIGLKGESTAFVTDAKGAFRAEGVSPQAILLFSHLGYETLEVPLEGRDFLQIELQPSDGALQNVTVHTGYQSLPRERATGSFVTIDSALLHRGPSLNILDRLEGVTSGLYFDRHDRNSGTQLQIRGLSGLALSRRAPLIVVDNFPYEGDLASLNPEDIESVTVLRDAAAASIWGARAGNGVIVLTTKKGARNTPARLSFSAQYTIRERDDLFSLPQVSTSTYIDMEQFLFGKGAYNADLSNTSNRPPVTPVVEILARQRAGLLTAAEASAQLNALREGDVRHDFQKYLYRTGLTQQYAAQLTGGGAQNTYLLSAGLDRSADQLVGNNLDRYTFRTHHQLQAAKNLQLQVGVQFTALSASNNNPGDYLSGAYRLRNRALYPYAQLADAAGNPLPINIKHRGRYTDTAGGGRLLDWKFRPLEELLNNDKKSGSAVWVGNLDLQYRFAKIFTAQGSYQYQSSSTQNRSIYNTNTFLARDLINRFTQLSPSGATYPIPKEGILDESHSRLQAHAVRTQLTAASIWGPHSLHAMAGSELRQTTSNGNSFRSYGFNDRLGTTAVDPTRPYRLYTGGTEFIPTGNSFDRRRDYFVSLYANAAYTYRGRYTVSGSARKDASNVYGVATNAKGTPLWSAGVAWKLSQEPFYPAPWPRLNLRLTYGFSGNTSPLQSALTTLYYSPAADQPIINLPFATITNYPNPHLRWEKVRQLNLGLDFSGNNNRVSGTLEYYRKLAMDVYGMQNLDLTTGIGAMVTNSANLKGEGIDLNLRTVNVESGSFEWTSHFLFSWVQNKVVQYGFPMNQLGYVSNGTTIVPIEGYAPYQVVSYRWAGLEAATGNPQGFVNKQVSKDYNALVRTPFTDQVVHGPAIPQFHGSLRNDLAWGSFSFSALLSYRMGYYFRRPTVSYSDIYTLGSIHPDYERRWQRPGDEFLTQVPSQLYPNPSINRDRFYGNSEVTAVRGDHLRLEDVRLGYLISKGAPSKLPFRQLQLFVMAAQMNQMLWRQNDLGLDPESPSGLVRGRTLSLGLKANF